MKLDKRIKISVSGIRGEAPKILTPRLCADLALRFSALMPAGPIIISRDPRPSGVAIYEAMIRSLLRAGRDIYDIGLATLPTTQLASKKWRVAGAIDITASHNPAHYNGLKFLDAQGLFINEAILKKIFTTSPSPHSSKKGKLNIKTNANDLHLQEILKKVKIKANLTVALDCVNGAGSEIIPSLLKALDCKVIPIACQMDKSFPHAPEPTPTNLGWTLKQLNNRKFDFGVVVDPDADRLVLIDENHALLSEEMTLPLVALQLYSHKLKGAIVVNMSTSNMIQAVAQRFGVRVVRSKVGEINVVEKMKQVRAGFGGEGNGGIIDPEVHYGRDSLVAVAYITQLLAETKQPLSRLVAQLPQLAMIKAKVARPAGDLLALYRLLANKYQGQADVNFDDGIRLDFSSSWVHLRPSNTEPIFRIIAEAQSIAKARAIISTFSDYLKDFPKKHKLR